MLLTRFPLGSQTTSTYTPALTPGGAKPNSYQLISTTPKMRNITVKPFKGNYIGSAEIEVRLKIECKCWDFAKT